MSRRRIHVAIGVADVMASIDDYTGRLGQAPTVVVPGAYALWRTEALNFSIRQSPDAVGVLRHLGWEDPDALGFTQDTDVNGIVWERFAAIHQRDEIRALWPDA